MSKKTLLGATALQTFAACGLAFAIAAPAGAQDTAQPAEEPVEEAQPGPSEVEIESGTNVAPAEGEAIVVTGSRIRRPNLESNVPITSIAGDAFFERGDNNVGDALNDLPQLRNTRQQNNSNLAVGVAGLNLLDLRGLGTVRTLTLVNGRRHVASDITSTAASTDVNTIPSDLIERVDIVTGGSSAIYGSNAIAGVVNFVLRRDFDGLQVRGHIGQAEEGYGENHYVSAMYGTNFADGRANVTVHGEYYHHDRVFGHEVPHIRRNNGLFITDVDPAGLPDGSDGIPDRTFIRDVRSTTIHPFGLVPITQRNTTPGCGLGIPNPTNQSAYNCNYIFQADGTLVPQTGTRFGAGITGGFAGGNGSTQREGELVTVYPENRRINFNLLAHYEISEALEPFLEAKWVRVNSDGGNAGPVGIQGTFVQFDFRERVRLDNPFLSAQARTLIRDSILASGCNTDLQTACGTGNLTAAQQAQVNDGSYRFVIARNLLDIGPRDELFERDTYRLVGGLRGQFNDDWNYEVSVNYGKMKERTERQGYVDRQRFMLSLDAGLNPVTGQIQCRAQFDPASAVAFNLPGTALTDAQRQGFNNRLAADIAACVPYNPFGSADNTAAANYFRVNEVHHAMLDQLVISGFVSGDSSQLFELPGGPIGFAIGAEYRKEGASYDQDDFTATGAPNSVAIGEIPLVHTKVKEAFAELHIPILKDEPFFEELAADAAGRIADYGGSIGTVLAYNAGLEWAPIRELRFRGNYARAVRAPNASETSFPIVPNFAPGFQDPCRAANIGGGSQYRAANCAAALGDLLTTPSFANIAAISLPVRSGSNPDLFEETSDSYTVGAVAQPIPGLSLSADYYNITVNNVIVAPGAQAIVNTCYDLPTLDNPFCALFTRYLGTTTSAAGEIPGQVANLSLLVAPLNYAKLVRRGIDFEAAYRTNISTDLRLDARLIYSLNLKNSNYINPVDPDFEQDNLLEVGQPKHEARLDAALTFGAFTLGYGLHYIGKMVTPLEVEDLQETQGRPPQNADYASILHYPETFYHDVRLEWDIKGLGLFGDNKRSNLNAYIGIDNLFDTVPPLGLQGNGERSGSTSTTQGTAIYESFGRRFYAGFKARF
ncbi:MAG TPA: TonB-dependent receptor [Sphingomicrobium sp.]